MSALDFHIARVGVGVTDLNIGRAFYEALGFDASPPFDLGTAIADQSDTPGSPLVIQIVRRGDFDLELVEHGGRRSPGRPPARRALNQLGLSHLALAVDDVERVAAVVEDHGGTVQPRVDGSSTQEQFCTDPFGARILLLGPASVMRGADSQGSDGIAVAHIGMSVADLEISTSFYRALGFEIGDDGTVPRDFDALAELDDVALRMRPMSLGPYRFQLLQWGPRRDPGAVVRLPLNRNGDLIHVGTHCDDFDAMLRIVVEGGGSIVERTRAQFPPPDLAMPWRGDPHGWVFTLDPNGVQIEIVGPTSMETSS